MKRFIVFACGLCSLWFAPLGAEAIQVGGSTEIGSAIASLDLRKSFGNITVELAPAFEQLSLSNPSITMSASGGSSSTLSLSASGSLDALLVQAGAYYTWDRVRNLDVYSGFLAGPAFIFGKADLDGMEVSLSGLAWNLKGELLGADLRLPDAPNFVFSTGIGVEASFITKLEADLPASLVNTILGESVAMTFTADPGLSIFSTFFSVGARISID